MDISNLQFNGLGLFHYRPRLEGRMAQMTVYYNDGRYSREKGIEVTLKMVTVDYGGRSCVSRQGDPCVSLIALPLTRYSKKRFIQALEKLDPHAPELAATYEADQEEGARKLKELVQELFVKEQNHDRRTKRE